MQSFSHAIRKFMRNERNTFNPVNEDLELKLIVNRRDREQSRVDATSRARRVTGM